VLNRLYRSKSFYLWSAVLLFLLIQTGHGRNRPSQDLLTSGRQALAAGNYNQAEDYLRRSIDRANAPEADTVLALADLGNLLLIEGRVNEAEAMLDRAIGMVRLNLTLDQRQLPILLGALGNLYRKTRRFKESEATLKEALQIGPRLLGETSVQVADLYNNFGVLHLAVGNTGKAKKDLKKALFINEKTIQDNDQHLARTLANLSSLYFTERKWSLAEPTMLRALHIVEQSLGPEHPDACTLLSNLGIIYYAQGKFGDALSRLGKCTTGESIPIYGSHWSVIRTLRKKCGPSSWSGAAPRNRRLLTTTSEART
jgi:tetratricopeptide (TPR) repeat protein